MTLTNHQDAEKAPELEPLKLADKPDGPGAAAMLAAGIGVLALGAATTLNEVSEGLNTFFRKFEMDRGVGPLAGKTTVAAIIFFLAWIVLGFLWKGKNVDIKRMFWIGLILGLIGAVFMFPPVFEAFAE